MNLTIKWDIGLINSFRSPKAMSTILGI